MQAEEPKAEPVVEPRPDPTGKHMYATKVLRLMWQCSAHLLGPFVHTAVLCSPSNHLPMQR